MTYDTIDNDVTMPGATGAPLGRSDAAGNVFDAKSVSDAVTMAPGGGLSLGRIDQYELVRELGGGGFGSVYLAKDTVAGIEVAVKGLPPMIRNNAEELERIRENFALVSRLHHPYIAAALHLQLAKEVSYASEDVRQKLRVLSGDTLMVMEYAPGVTLSQWRRQFPDGRVPLEVAIQIVWQVAQALDYAHEQHIIHRDVKPSNVMVETKPDGEIVARILDFGLAAEIRSSMGRVSREVRDTSGTRPYMAPEQWAGRKQGPATDQYALAAMFYELLTGEVPFASVFDTGDPVVMMTAVCNREVEFPEDCPRKAALRRALAKDPLQRFVSCVEFLETAAKSEPMPAPATDSKPKVKNGSGRKLAILGAAGICIVFAIIGGVVWHNHKTDVRRHEHARIVAEREAAIERQKRETAEKHLEDERRREADALAKQKKETAEHSSNEASIAIAMQKAETAHEGTQRGQLGTKEGDDGRGKVQLWEGGPYWAEMNIGAEKPWEYGLYFWWGDIVGYRCVNGVWMANDGSSSNFSFDENIIPTYNKPCSSLKSEGWIMDDNTLVTEHDAAHIQWGGSWRMPTVQELDSLLKKCELIWTTTNGVRGYIVCGKGDYASSRIFLPSAGFADKTSLIYDSWDGYYWSSNPYSIDTYSCGLFFQPMRRHNSSRTITNFPRNRGLTIRPVQGCFSSDNQLASPPSKNDTLTEGQERMTVGLNTGETKVLTLPGGAPIEMIYVGPGEFMMGSTIGDADETPVHKVRLTRGYWLGKYEITQRQWKSVMKGNPSRFNGDDHPVDSVSWDGCHEFLGKIQNSVMSQLGNFKARLPTEAEWEYACRAGTTGEKAHDLEGVAWYDGNSGSKTHVVGMKRANAWGFHDMIGNLSEWCSDLYGVYNCKNSVLLDPQGPVLGRDRVIRGGSWCSPVQYSRPADRSGRTPGKCYDYCGFRLCCSAGPRVQHQSSSSQASSTANSNAAIVEKMRAESEKIAADESARKLSAEDADNARIKAWAVFDRLTPNVKWPIVLAELYEIESSCRAPNDVTRLYITQAKYMRNAHEYILNNCKGALFPVVKNGIVQDYDSKLSVLNVSTKMGAATVVRGYGRGEVLDNRAVFDSLYAAAILKEDTFKRLNPRKHAELMIGAALLVKCFPCGMSSRETRVKSILDSAIKRCPECKSDVDFLFAEYFTSLKYKYNYTIDKNGHIHLWGKGESEPCISPKPEGVFALPTEIDGHKVVQLGWHAFAGCDKMTTFIFPKDVVQGFWIDPYIFRNCPKLHRVIFQGDAPGLHVPPNTNSKGRNIFSFCAPDIVVEVKKGSKGWKDKNSTELPPRWPTMGYDSRPIRHITK